MADPLGMGVQLAGQALRLGWYFGLNRVVDWQTSRLGSARPKPPSAARRRPAPTMTELLADIASLVLADAAAVRDGLYPPIAEEPGGALDHLDRVRGMLADLPGLNERRAVGDARSARRDGAAADLPDYFTQDFHFQSGGYLTETSARLYDVQVETLFMGAAGPMRRAALRPIAEHVRGRDQRALALLDVACGTGRFLAQVRQAFPALNLTGLDLSRAYLAEAERGFQRLRPARWIEANAEAMPLDEGSFDIATSIFLFHELPGEVRRRVLAEMARVTRPGGLVVLLDSLQLGDRPDWDGLLEAFPARFHEPYYRHYLTDDLARLATAAGLRVEATSQAFLAKVVVCGK